MADEKQTIGLIGVGKIGLPFGASLVDAGYEVVCTKRGRSDELVAKGGAIAGDGSPRAVAEAADIVLTCLPVGNAFEEVVSGDDGLLTAEGTAPIVIEASTVSIPIMEQARDKLAAAGGDLLDCPVSGTPPMAAEKKAVVFASGDKGTYDQVADVITAFAPVNVYVGELGAGTNFKYVANLLAFVHVTAAAEAMAFASAAGLDLKQVAAVISQSPGATSGQFNIRAPLMAEGKFDDPMVTVDVMRHVCDQIVQHADEVGASTPLLAVVRDTYEEFAAEGEGASDPGKLSVYLQEKARAKTG
jgi:3-hydroxyisobutyrate dehydrogenase-like beta-hydroxyacid dehydrogenase